MKQLLTTIVAATCVALLGLAGLAGPAHADETQGQQPVVVVADFSGSMNEADADAQGTTRIEAAKAAVAGLLEQAPGGSRLGLVVFGANNDSCSDIETVNPVGGFDAEALQAQVNGLAAKGNTPIGPALTHAAKELDGIEGPRSIVLVSDGEPNCEPPPACDVAKDLADQGIDLTVHTIGFKISGNQKAKSTLQCIADATGGTYTDVENGSELADALQTETIRALAGYQSAGQEVAGGELVDHAEELVAGQYVVRMVSGEQPDLPAEPTARANRRYFSVPSHEGWDIALSATLVPPPVESGGELDVERGIILNEVSPAGTRCSSFTRERQGGWLAETDLTAQIAIRDGSACAQDGDVYFSISRYLDGWADQELEVEFTVAYHRADEASIGSVAEPEVPAEPLTPGEPTEVAGGTSFNDAVLLEPGQTISDDVAPGERRYFKVPLGYGQSMRAHLEAGAVEGVNGVALSAFNPLRQMMRFAQGEDTHTHGNLSVMVGDEGKILDAPLALPIMPGNALGGQNERLHSYPGEHFLVVGRDWAPDRDEATMPYTLTVAVHGEAAESQGALIATPEQYEAEFGAAVEPSPSPSSSPTEEPTETPSAAPSARPEPEESAEPTTTATDGQEVPWVPVLGGAGLLLIAAGGVWLVTRRR